MGFFAEFDGWLRRLLERYIEQNTLEIARTIEPFVLALATLYIMVWAYLQMTGRIEEPVTTGIKKIVGLAVVFAVAIHLWLYNTVIVESLFEGPRALAGAIVGAYEPVAIVDRIMFQGDEVAQMLFRRADIWTLSYAFAGIAVYLIMGFVAVYAIFLLSLSRIALSVLLAIGPLFIVALLFETSKRFFEAWMAQLVHFAMIAVLTVLLAALMINVLETAAHDAVNAGDGISIALAARMCMAAGLTLLVLRQVNVIASGLASGIALATGGVMSGLTAWALGRSFRSASQFTRGAMLDRETTRWDGLSRKSGYYVGKGISTAGGAAWRRMTGRWRNSMRAG